MSRLVGTTTGLGQVIRASDGRAVDDWWTTESVIIAGPATSVGDDFGDMSTWVTPWWPGGGGALTGSIVGSPDGALCNRSAYATTWTVSGASGRLAFVGFTRDAYGSPLASCTVRCFVTSSNELVSQVTSDGNGYYVATTPYGSVGHFLTVHKTGSPDVCGATVDTLLPA